MRTQESGGVAEQNTAAKVEPAIGIERNSPAETAGAATAAEPPADLAAVHAYTAPLLADIGWHRLRNPLWAGFPSPSKAATARACGAASARAAITRVGLASRCAQISLSPEFEVEADRSDARN